MLPVESISADITVVGRRNEAIIDYSAGNTDRRRQWESHSSIDHTLATSSSELYILRSVSG